MATTSVVKSITKARVMKLKPSPLKLPTAYSVPSDPLASIHHTPLIPGFWDEVLKFTVLYPLGLHLCASFVTHFFCFLGPYSDLERGGMNLLLSIKCRFKDKGI